MMKLIALGMLFVLSFCTSLHFELLYHFSESQSCCFSRQCLVWSKVVLQKRWTMCCTSMMLKPRTGWSRLVLVGFTCSRQLDCAVSVQICQCASGRKSSVKQKANRMLICVIWYLIVGFLRCLRTKEL